MAAFAIHGSGGARYHQAAASSQNQTPAVFFYQGQNLPMPILDFYPEEMFQMRFPFVCQPSAILNPTCQLFIPWEAFCK